MWFDCCEENSATSYDWMNCKFVDVVLRLHFNHTINSQDARSTGTAKCVETLLHDYRPVFLYSRLLLLPRSAVQGYCQICLLLHVRHSHVQALACCKWITAHAYMAFVAQRSCSLAVTTKASLYHGSGSECCESSVHVCVTCQIAMASVSTYIMFSQG